MHFTVITLSNFETNLYGISLTHVEVFYCLNECSVAVTNHIYLLTLMVCYVLLDMDRLIWMYLACNCYIGPILGELKVLSCCFNLWLTLVPLLMLLMLLHMLGRP